MVFKKSYRKPYRKTYRKKRFKKSYKPVRTNNLPRKKKAPLNLNPLKLRVPSSLLEGLEAMDYMFNNNGMIVNKRYTSEMWSTYLKDIQNVTLD